MPYITKQFKFCAAHKYWNENWSDNENLQIFADDVRIHGHNYQLDVTIAGQPCKDSGFILNLSDLKEVVENKVIKVLDHSQIDADVHAIGVSSQAAGHVSSGCALTY